MSTFSYIDELKKIITTKQLVEVNVHGDGEHLVAYLLAANEEYLLFSQVTNDATFGGTTLRLTRDIESIQVETQFIKELSKDIDDDSLYQQAMKSIHGLKELSFEGIAELFEDSDTIISIKTVNDTLIAGKVIAHDDDILVIDEYYLQERERVARTYLNPSQIQYITIGSAWLQITQRAITDSQ